MGGWPACRVLGPRNSAAGDVGFMGRFALPRRSLLLSRLYYCIILALKKKEKKVFAVRSVRIASGQ